MSGFTLPDDDDSDITLTPSMVETDHDQITLTTLVTTDELERLSRYRDAGVVDRQPTAFGAFRRVPRDGSDPVTIEPPAELSPPFEPREVVAIESEAEQVAPNRHELTLTFGLVEPRPREPIDDGDDGEAEQIGSENITLGAGETDTVTVTGLAPGTLGDYAAAVSSDDESDTTLVSVTDAEVAIAWPVATLPLALEQIGQLSRAPEQGRERFTLPVQLTPDQAEILLAAGSRVEAVRTRETPDARNVVRDTLPDEELTANIEAPDALGDDVDGEAVLVNWSLTWARPERNRPIDAELTFVALD